jgi:hypothetical protein
LKANTKTYLLLVAVLALWGAIGYKVISALSPSEKEVVANEVVVNFTPNQTDIKNFDINPVPRDPFLGKISHSTSKKRTPKTNYNKIKEPWPQIEYQGMIKKQGAASQVFIVNINQVQFMLRKNEVIQSIKLLDGTGKGIKVRFNKQIKTFNVL